MGGVCSCGGVVWVGNAAAVGEGAAAAALALGSLIHSGLATLTFSHTLVVRGTVFVGGSSPSLTSASGSGTVSYSVFSAHISIGNEMNSEYFLSMSRMV